MIDVSIVGVGNTAVGEFWDMGLRELAAEAIQNALKETNVTEIDALYVGNAYGSSFSSQTHLGTLIADYAGLKGVEASTIEAAEASGGAALRTAVMAVASGLVKTALVVGVEKSTDTIGGARTEARSISLDAEYESIHGATLPALAALLMRRYMYEYGVELSAFEGFSVNAHANGKRNPEAMFRNTLKPGAFSKAPMVADPVNLFDGAPDADGAAAVIVTSSEHASDLTAKPINIAASSAATDTLKVQDRKALLVFEAVRQSVEQAFAQAGISHDDVDLFELHDSFTIVTAMTLEAAGFAEPGKGWQMAEHIGLDGKLPISTFGGLKSRGNPVGATGVYQAVEAVKQLRGEAGENQVKNASTALIQNMGGIGSTVVTHVLKTTS